MSARWRGRLQARFVLFPALPAATPALGIGLVWFVPLGDGAGVPFGALALLLAFFGLRVLGQLVVAGAAPSWLPPMERWYSGVLPYRFLLPAQVVLVVIMAFVTVEVARAGPLARSNHDAATAIVLFSYVYAGSMLVRAARWLLTPADRRGVVLPIPFHFVLAAFCLVYGSWLARATG